MPRLHGHKFVVLSTLENLSTKLENYQMVACFKPCQSNSQFRRKIFTTLVFKYQNVLSIRVNQFSPVQSMVEKFACTTSNTPNSKVLLN